MARAVKIMADPKLAIVNKALAKGGSLLICSRVFCRAMAQLTLNHRGDSSRLV
jgi:hypothetical protein